jgi:hypothetical protein
MKTQTLYRRMPIEQRKIIRKTLNNIIKKRKEQREIFESGLIIPLTKNIKMTEAVLRSECSFEQYMKSTECLDKYLNEWLEGFSNGRR